MDNETSPISSREEKKKGLIRWLNSVVYELFYYRTVEEIRSEIFQILGQELVLSPLYRKLPYQTTIPHENCKEILKAKIKTMSSNNLEGKYNKPEELISLAECFKFLSSKKK